MGAANKLQPEYLRASDLYETVNDPISRIMRKECPQARYQASARRVFLRAACARAGARGRFPQ